VLASVVLHDSKGSYVQDADGNVLLDLSSMETLPLGYNHAAFMTQVNSKEIDTFIMNNQLAADFTFSANLAEKLRESFASIAPKGLNGVTLVNGQNAVEQAVFDAMSERGIQEFSVLGFENSYHGNSLALAAFAHPRMAPDMGWPAV